MIRRDRFCAVSCRPRDQRDASSRPCKGCPGSPVEFSHVASNHYSPFVIFCPNPPAYPPADRPRYPEKNKGGFLSPPNSVPSAQDRPTLSTAQPHRPLVVFCEVTLLPLAMDSTHPCAKVYVYLYISSLYR